MTSQRPPGSVRQEAVRWLAIWCRVIDLFISYILRFLSLSLSLWCFGGSCQNPEPVWRHSWITGGSLLPLARRPTDCFHSGESEGLLGGHHVLQPQSTYEQIMSYVAGYLAWVCYMKHTNYAITFHIMALMCSRLWSVIIIMSHFPQFCTKIQSGLMCSLLWSQVNVLSLTINEKLIWSEWG